MANDLYLGIAKVSAPYRYALVVVKRIFKSGDCVARVIDIAIDVDVKKTHIRDITIHKSKIIRYSDAVDWNVIKTIVSQAFDLLREADNFVGEIRKSGK